MGYFVKECGERKSTVFIHPADWNVFLSNAFESHFATLQANDFLFYRLFY